MSFYYVDNKNQQRGPFSGSVIKELALVGVITPRTMLISDKGVRALAGTVKGLDFPTQPVPSSPVNLTKSSTHNVNDQGLQRTDSEIPPTRPNETSVTFDKAQQINIPPVAPSPFDNQNSPFAQPNPAVSNPFDPQQVYGIQPGTIPANPIPNQNPVVPPSSGFQPSSGQKEYKVVAGPKIIQVDMGHPEHAFDAYSKIINAETVHGWRFHSIENITVEEDKGCAGAILQLVSTIAPFFAGTGENTRTSYYMLIFERDK